MTVHYAVRELADEWGVSFGAALERLLEDPSAFLEIRDEMAITGGDEERDYLPRTVMSLEAVMAVEASAQHRGVSFGEQIEAILHARDDFAEPLRLARESFRRVLEQLSPR